MSLKIKLFRLFINIRNSKTFKNIKSFEGITYTVVMTATANDLINNYNKKKKEKKRIMANKNIIDENLLTEEELENCKINFFDVSRSLLTILMSHVVGISIGVFSPAIILTIPACYLLNK